MCALLPCCDLTRELINQYESFILQELRREEQRAAAAKDKQRREETKRREELRAAAKTADSRSSEKSVIAAAELQRTKVILDIRDVILLTLSHSYLIMSIDACTDER